MRTSKRAYSIQAILTSRDTAEVLDRLKAIDLETLKFSRSIYQGYQRLNERTKTSLNYYCELLSMQSANRSPSYFKNWYIIYRHFCIRCYMRMEDLVGLDYRMMKFIAEAKKGLFSISVTEDAVLRLNDPMIILQQKWEFLKERKKHLKSQLYDTNIYG